MRRRYQQGRLTSGRWKKLRAQVIREEPVCRLRLPGCTVWSDSADHIIPVSQRPDLKYMRANVRGACQSCNMARKNRPLSAVREDMKLAQPKSVSRPAAALEFFT